MFYDQSGNLNVNVARSRSRTPARSADVAGQLRAQGMSTLGTTPMVVREAKYDYLQLATWSERLPEILGMRGVVFTDIDERENRLRIGITPGTSDRPVERALVRLGIPREAVIISRTPPIRRLATLRDRVRPLAGGLQIAFGATAQGYFVCTLGFNARIPSVSGANFFVTNSHCTGEQGGNQNTVFFQPNPPYRENTFANRYIGIESRDPAYGNPGGLCPAGLRCRFSDAALVRYAPGVEPDLGSIFRTTFSLSRLGSIEIDSRTPEWTVVGEVPFPFLGQTMNKVGRSTGWTTGPVIGTCVDTGVFGTDIVQLCQDFVFSGVRGGDSGSPIFQRVSSSSSDVRLAGVLWGGGELETGETVYVFSSMENIEFELGPLTTTSAGMVAAAP